MESKVCTKCKEEKCQSKFSPRKNGKTLAACRECSYKLYQRPSAIKRLRAAGKCPFDEKVFQTPEEKREIRNRRWKEKYENKKLETPPKIPKEQWAEKPPIIRLSLQDTMSPEEYKEHRREVKRQYRKNNREKHRLQRRRDYKNAIKRPEVRVAKNLRKRLKEFIAPGNRLGSFSKMVGCTKEELLQHVESQFVDGMTWENYGANGWHIDHIRPLASFDLTDKKTWAEVNHYTNLRPMWADENLGKANFWEGVKWEKGKPV